jgi:plasmid stabilization system protein ParE
MYRLIFHPKAEQEFLNAVIWYEERKEGLGLQFINEIESTLTRLSNNPLQYKIEFGSFHVAVVDVFPFVITYKFNSIEKYIYVSAVFHTSRNPRLKFRRKPKS